MVCGSKQAKHINLGSYVNQKPRISADNIMKNYDVYNAIIETIIAYYVIIENIGLDLIHTGCSRFRKCVGLLLTHFMHQM